jgi:hypothetical protein
MKKPWYIWLAIGVLLGIPVGGWLLRWGGLEQTPTNKGYNPDTAVDILFATRPIPAGTVLEDGMVAIVSVPVFWLAGEYIPEDKLDWLENVPTARDLRFGDSIRWSDASRPLNKPSPPETPYPINSYDFTWPKDGTFWDVVVFVSGPEDVLAQIDCVEYFFPPSFDKRVQRICERSDGYPYSVRFSAWGVFKMPVTITMKNGDVIHLEHQVR